MATPSTVATYTLNNSQRDFDLTFDYLSQTFVQVSLIGATTQILTLGSDYTFLSPTVIRTTLTYGPPSWSLIEIRRVTSTTERLVEFNDASILHAAELNLSDLQVLHVAEEARNAATETIGVNNDGNLDARGRRIVNVTDPVDDGDVVTLRYYAADVTGAQASRIAAEAARDAALASETAAAGSAASAAASASSATAGAASATASASAAAGSASAASTSASAAAGSASSALSSANAAASSYDSFDDRYLGSKAANPTVDNDGGALLTGALYWNTTSGEMRVWNGSSWVATFLPAGAYAPLSDPTFTTRVTVNCNIEIDGFTSGFEIRFRKGFSNATSGGAGISPYNHSGAGSADGMALYGHDGVSIWTAQVKRAQFNLDGTISLLGATSVTGALSCTGAATVGAATAASHAIQKSQVEALVNALPVKSVYVSPEQTITAAGGLTLAHGLPSTPYIVQFRLVCKVAEHGYSVGDTISVDSNADVGSGGSSQPRGHQAIIGATNIVVRYGSAGQTYGILHATTGAALSITNANWRLVVIALSA